MPLYRDKLTGQIKNFDHEPSEAELHAAFGTGEGGPAPAPAAQAAPSAPPAPAAHEGPGLLSKFLTKVGAPLAGGAIGGALGGPLGFPLGVTAGKAYGDLADMYMGGGIPDPSQEAIELASTFAGSGVAAAGAPYLKKIPGPPSLRDIGLGALGGGMAGREIGHPGLGAAVGGALSGYGALASVLRGLGGATEALSTQRFGLPKTLATSGEAGIPPSSPKLDINGPEVQAYVKGAARSGVPNGFPKALNAADYPAPRPKVSKLSPWNYGDAAKVDKDPGDVSEFLTGPGRGIQPEGGPGEFVVPRVPGNMTQERAPLEDMLQNQAVGAKAEFNDAPLDGLKKSTPKPKSKSKPKP